MRKFKYFFELLFVNNRVFGLVLRLVTQILEIIHQRWIKRILNYTFVLVRFVLNVMLNMRFGIYSSIGENINLIIYILWLIIKFIFSPIRWLFKFFRSEIGRKILAHMTWLPIIAYLSFSIIWIIYILSNSEQVIIIFNVLRIPNWSDLSASIVYVRLFFIVTGFLFVICLFIIRVINGSVPLSAGLALLRAFALSLILLVVSQLHNTIFFIKNNFMSLNPNSGTTILDFGWIRVDRTVSDLFMTKYIACYTETHNSLPLDQQQMTNIIESSGGSVDLAKNKMADLISLATKVFNVSGLSTIVVQNTSVVANFAATNPKFITLLALMGLFGGLRLYYKGLVGLCPLHTFGDFVGLIERLPTQFVRGDASKKVSNPDDLIPGYWFGNPYDPWILPVSWYSGLWYAYCVAGWYGIEADVYYSTFGHSLLEAINKKRGVLSPAFYNNILLLNSDWYPPLRSTMNLPVTTYHAILSTINGSTLVGSVFLTNTVLDLVRNSAVHVEQQRISNFVYINDDKHNDDNNQSSLCSHNTLPLIVNEDDNSIVKTQDNQVVVDTTIEKGEEYFSGDEENVTEFPPRPRSPKPWDSPSRGWPRMRLGYTDEEFELIIGSNDPESVGSSDGRTAASIARKAASIVDEHGWQTALDYQPVHYQHEDDDFPECPPNEKGKEKLYPEDNKRYLSSFSGWNYLNPVPILCSVFGSTWHLILSLFVSQTDNKENSDTTTSSRTTTRIQSVTHDQGYGVPDPEQIYIPESVLKPLHPLHAADLLAYANSPVKDQIQVIPGVGVISPKSPYLNKNIPMSSNLSYLLFDVFAPITRFMLASPILGVPGTDWAFYLSMFSIGTSLINRVVKVLDIFSGKEYITPLISRGFITPEERAAVALYELQLDRKLKPTTAGYFFPFPRGANFIMRLWGEEKFVMLYKDYIQGCIHRLTNTQLLELKDAFADQSWNKLIAKSPQELSEFMLKHKSMGSYLVQARNQSHLEVSVLSRQDGSGLFESVNSTKYNKPPTDAQIRAYLRVECDLISAELERRRVGGPFDKWDYIHYEHILLRQGRFPVLQQSWLGHEHFNLTVNGKMVEVVREPPFFRPHEIQPFDCVNRHARVAQLIRVIESGNADAVCFQTPKDFKFIQPSPEELNQSFAIDSNEIPETFDESSIV